MGCIACSQRIGGRRARATAAHLKEHRRSPRSSGLERRRTRNRAAKTVNRREMTAIGGRAVCRPSLARYRGRSVATHVCRPLIKDRAILPAVALRAHGPSIGARLLLGDAAEIAG